MKKYIFDIFMAKIRVAKETPVNERTKEQRDLLIKFNSAPSYNSLFR